jgi:NADH-quinone oxidoreductase subunit E
VIAILWLVQKQEGWVSEPAIRAVAELLGMPVIRVLECATFYTMFMLEPVGTHALVQVCGTTPCQTRGAEALMAVCKRKIGPQDHRSADGKFYWQEVECLGACANAPMAAINDYYYEDLTPEASRSCSTTSRPARSRSRARTSAARVARRRRAADADRSGLYDGRKAKPFTPPQPAQGAAGLTRTGRRARKRSFFVS